MLLAVLFSSWAADRSPPRPYVNLPVDGGSPRLTALVGGNVLPMTPSPETVLPGATVLLDGDRIVAVGDVPVPRGATVVDLSGRWVLPGLMDTHVHVFDERELPLFLAAGVTSIVNMSGGPQVLEWRRQAAERGVASPRVWTTGPMIDELDDALFGTTVGVGSEADAHRVVREHVQARYDLVKMHGDLEVGLYDAVMDAAQGAGVPVVGHLSERVGLLHAMKRRQATVEHTEELVYAFFNGRLDHKRIPTAIDAIQRGGAAVTPTLVSIERIARMLTDDIDVLAAAPVNAWMPPLARSTWGRTANPYRRVHGPEEAAWFRESLAFQLELTAALEAAGVPLFAGTDSGRWTRWWPTCARPRRWKSRSRPPPRGGTPRWRWPKRPPSGGGSPR